MTETIDPATRHDPMADFGERERAADYEAHRDDPDEWDDGVPVRPCRRLASMVSVRLSPDEAGTVREAAQRLGMSVSAFLRAAALAESAPVACGPSTGSGASGAMMMMVAAVTDAVDPLAVQLFDNAPG